MILIDIEDYSANPPEDHGDIEGVEWLTKVIESIEPYLPKLEFNMQGNAHTLLFVGGATGLPKGCQLTHRNLVASAL